MEAFEDLKFVFFVNYGDQLPDYYYHLANSFKNQGLTLVPVQLDQLLMLHQGKKRVHVVCITSNLTEKRKFLKTHRIIKQCIMNKIATVYHVTCFHELNFHNTIGRIPNYHFIKLPIEFDVLSGVVFKCYSEEIKNESKWIGGRKGRFSFNGIEDEK